MNVELPANIQQFIEEGMAEKKISLLGVMFSLILNLFMDVLFSTLGGLIGWSVFKPKSLG
jgi:hypothetical protein